MNKRIAILTILVATFWGIAATGPASFRQFLTILANETSGDSWILAGMYLVSCVAGASATVYCIDGMLELAGSKINKWIIRRIAHSHNQ